MGYLIDPPQHVEGDYVAVFAQTAYADSLAQEFLKARGLHPILMPQIGKFLAVFGAAIGPGPGLYGTEALLCVPHGEAEAALHLLQADSGLVHETRIEGDAE